MIRSGNVDGEDHIEDVSVYLTPSTSITAAKPGHEYTTCETFTPGSSFCVPTLFQTTTFIFVSFFATPPYLSAA